MKWIRKIFRKGFFGKRSSIHDFLRHPDDYEIRIFTESNGEIHIVIKRRIV